MTDPTTPSLAERPEVRRYCDALLLALRMAGVPGPRIGEVLAEVRGHLAETGGDPVESFGAPEEYAAALTGDRAPRTTGERFRSGLTGGAFALGGWWLAEGAGALATDRPVTLGAVPLVGAALAAVGAGWVLEQVASSSRRRVAAGVLAVSVALAAVTALGLALDDSVGISVPAAVPVLLGLLGLALGTLSLRGAADPVAGPLEPAAEVQARRHRDGVLLTGALWAWLLLLVALAAGVAVLADRLG